MWMVRIGSCRFFLLDFGGCSPGTPLSRHYFGASCITSKTRVRFSRPGLMHSGYRMAPPFFFFCESCCSRNVPAIVRASPPGSVPAYGNGCHAGWRRVYFLPQVFSVPVCIVPVPDIPVSHVAVVTEPEFRNTKLFCVKVQPDPDFLGTII